MSFPSEEVGRLEKALKFEVHGYTQIKGADLFNLIMWARGADAREIYLRDQLKAAEAEISILTMITPARK
jgi:hypothetical protein